MRRFVIFPIIVTRYFSVEKIRLVSAHNTINIEFFCETIIFSPLLHADFFVSKKLVSVQKIVSHS